jgi:hypothetical protein
MGAEGGGQKTGESGKLEYRNPKLETNSNDKDGRKHSTLLRQGYGGPAVQRSMAAVQWQPRKIASRIKVPMTETTIEPRQPRRLEKKANIQ